MGRYSCAMEHFNRVQGRYIIAMVHCNHSRHIATGLASLHRCNDSLQHCSGALQHVIGVNTSVIWINTPVLIHITSATYQRTVAMVSWKASKQSTSSCNLIDIICAAWHCNQSACHNNQTMRRSSDVMTRKHEVT
jgi:hypothetical protein